MNSNVNDESSILEMNLSNEINAILEDDEDEYLSDNSARKIHIMCVVQ